MKFTFNRGSWEDSNPLPGWEENEEFNDYLKRVGFNTSKNEFGHEFGGQIDIYESSDGTRFYASVCSSGSTIFEVFLPDFPSMMMFIKDYAPAFSAESSNFTTHEILNLLEKLFLLQHGHSVHSICAQCDPEGWKENLRRREERLKSQNKNG